MNNHQTLPHILRIGEQKIPVRDLLDASHAYLLARDTHDVDQSGKISIGNNKYTITRDGRVWHNGACIVEPQP